MASFEEGQRLCRLRSIAQLGVAHPGKNLRSMAPFKHTAPGLKVGWLSAEGYDGRADT